MMRQALLPSNSTAFEVALSQSLDRLPELMTEFDKIRYADLHSNPAALDALIAGYGLERVTQYIPSLLFIIERGIAWQRVVGTPEAVKLGLAWLNYVATLEQSPSWRRKWHAVQLRFPTLPANDNPDLGNIEGVVGHSLPARSYLRRGVHLHDIPAGECDAQKYESAMYDSDSGVKLSGSNVKWSFGRKHEFIHTLTEEEGTAIGNWLPPVGASLTWNDANFPWTDANFPWSSNASDARKAAMAAWFETQPIYLAIKNPVGDLHGFRRLRACKPVNLIVGGFYAFGGSNYAAMDGGKELFVDAMTGFGDFTAGTAGRVALRIGGTPIPSVKPGQLRLGPAQLTGGYDIAEQVVSIPLRATVRDHFKFLLRF